MCFCWLVHIDSSNRLWYSNPYSMIGWTPHNHHATGARGCEHCSVEVFNVDQTWKGRSTRKGVRRISMKGWNDFRNAMIYWTLWKTKAWSLNWVLTIKSIMWFLRFGLFPTESINFHRSHPILAWCERPPQRSKWAWTKSSDFLWWYSPICWIVSLDITNL
jgi:hypothetical protein